MSGKTIGIIAYITLIGWVIALILNLQEKDGFASFHIRQMLGIIFLAMLGPIPLLGWFAAVVAFVFWIIGLFSAINGRMAEVPVLGEHFQKWFRGL